jgi:hypothetical protein
MKEINIYQVLAFALAISVGVLAYNLFTFQNAQKSINSKNEMAQVELSVKISRVDSSIKIANTNSTALAKSILYLDSCQQQKVFKQDRAERRGRFVGGLLKGLLPHL